MCVVYVTGEGVLGTTIIAGASKSDHLNLPVYLPQAGIEPGLRVNVYLNLIHALTHSKGRGH